MFVKLNSTQAKYKEERLNLENRVFISLKTSSYPFPPKLYYDVGWNFPAMTITPQWPFAAMCTQFVWLMGLTSTWAHNLFVLWAFVFLIVGGPMLGRPKYDSISLSLSPSLTELLLCSLLSVCTLLLILFPELPTLFFSFSSLIYSSRLVDRLWLMIIQVISGIRGSIPLFQSGCLGGSGKSGIGIASHLRRSAWWRYSLR